MFFARWRHSATKLLNKKVITAFSIQYCRHSPTSTQFGSGVFKIFAMKHAGPVFLGHPVDIQSTCQAYNSRSDVDLPLIKPYCLSLIRPITYQIFHHMIPYWLFKNFATDTS